MRAHMTNDFFRENENIFSWVINLISIYSCTNYDLEKITLNAKNRMQVTCNLRYSSPLSNPPPQPHCLMQVLSVAYVYFMSSCAGMTK